MNTFPAQDIQRLHKSSQIKLQYLAITGQGVPPTAGGKIELAPVHLADWLADKQARH